MLQVHLGGMAGGPKVVEWLEVPKVVEISFKLDKLMQELRHQEDELLFLIQLKYKMTLINLA